jgi:hypothetical protein
VLAGVARADVAAPAADENPDYVAKYGEDMARVSGSRGEFAAAYVAALRIEVRRVRGH